jgi:hypothetical protein
MNHKLVNEVVLNYQEFLNNAWSFIEKLKKIDDPNLEYFDEDWLQSNWEIMVENIICEPGNEYLEVYGPGADCNGDSSRVFLPNATATHRICCRPLGGKQIIDLISKKEVNILNFTWDQFVSWDGTWYYTSSPFEYALLQNLDSKKDQEIVVKSNEVVFEIEKI